jgi:hypothetical protein
MLALKRMDVEFTVFWNNEFANDGLVKRERGTFSGLEHQRGIYTRGSCHLLHLPME